MTKKTYISKLDKPTVPYVPYTDDPDVPYIPVDPIDPDLNNPTSFDDTIPTDPTLPTNPDKPNIIVPETDDTTLPTNPDKPNVIVPETNDPTLPTIPGKPIIMPPPPVPQPIYGFNANLKNLTAAIKCTWANAYTEPETNRGLCIISYDRKMLKKLYNTDSSAIGTLTGNTATDYKNRLWYEVNLLYANRRNVGWVKDSAVTLTTSTNTSTTTTNTTNTTDTTASTTTSNKKKGLLGLGIFAAIAYLFSK